MQIHEITKDTEHPLKISRTITPHTSNVAVNIIFPFLLLPLGFNVILCFCIFNADGLLAELPLHHVVPLGCQKRSKAGGNRLLAVSVEPAGDTDV